MECALALKLFSRHRKNREEPSHSIRDYQALVRRNLRDMPGDRSLALATSIGSPTMEGFARQGDAHVAVLRAHGLADGMAIYDLGCGCGRTAQALQRSGWEGSYTGADVVPELLEELAAKCPGYDTRLHYLRTIVAADDTLDLVFGWSVFTHLYPAESYLYMVDSWRALKPGGKLVFSFLEQEEPEHSVVWDRNLAQLRKGEAAEQLDTFLHRDWIRKFAKDAGFGEPLFTDGMDGSTRPKFWQALAILEKPAAS